MASTDATVRYWSDLEVKLNTNTRFSYKQIQPPVSHRGFRIAEAARYMGVSAWFVELKLRSGELRGLKLCRHWTILREDMDKFLDEAASHAVTEVAR